MFPVLCSGNQFAPTLTDADLHLIGEGNELRLYDKLGAQLGEVDGIHGTAFSVWAPNAKRVSVVGDFNSWNGRRHIMRNLDESGLWEVFVPGVGQGTLYKFELINAQDRLLLKTDPMGRFFEKAPKNAAIVWDAAGFEWSDQVWLEQRAKRDEFESPMSIYEVHLGSWRKHNDAESYSYRELASEMVDYVREMNFTHVEFMPVAEHAYYPSWGYQVTGFYAPTSRYGTPDDFAALVNALHEAGIGVILDWVPAHFPKDDFALAQFDGTALYEHADPRRGDHPDWGTHIFNYGRPEVRNYLTANALYWCDLFHIDGLRVDAVASMLYLDYSRGPGEWLPNKHGGRENLEAVDFLKQVNHHVLTRHPGVVTIAEESTDWPKVTHPPSEGGLGFSFKWNMGWMHDNLAFLRKEPVLRKGHFDKATFAMLYHYGENYVLPLSHDEVVHLKGSLLGKMPGDDWQRLANLRLLLGFQWTFPGKLLLFMGGEIGQANEWIEDRQLDWPSAKEDSPGRRIQSWVRDLNRLYRDEPALWEADYDRVGFRWVNCTDRNACVLSFLRHNKSGTGTLLVVVNFTPVRRNGYRIGVPMLGRWEERLNSDADIYGGSKKGSDGYCEADSLAMDGFDQSLAIELPPLAVVVFRLLK
jgi:1,4-alpha-glucan branching enzyme